MTGRPQTVWHGTDQEVLDLLLAIQRYCTCQQQIGYVCQGHRALRDDQHFVDGVLNVRRRAEQQFRRVHRGDEGLGS